ncbi:MULTISPECIES: GNAT family N-acetyltransferase [unclassified Microbacterium]|uniref:GNAT family N-acetyltransferase n=1 Tax=unclassified Microbacterium TaxID=2609290 RepID=UPI000CFBDFF7|nr:MULTISPECIES: GNAT family N-acetyltransferase [unclassified Microbacterium]PQZ53486.1 GNAT family N-acetyltransferase [Microbacterium sp. MYb43]PQZ75089.1 GNAT family N-acetyltransferase [Microbacterium sp. MYb40]PRB19383.1 GNAT family N-acetyltransferase [Microbacterium sp. MYb54]PRB24584.1 GNAT family N-acetyltransferase [Microbacterium sp. MYb50]PRB63695.1 GNAT family N-acetyltransferase [Microbacterium sp. MYb24]
MTVLRELHPESLGDITGLQRLLEATPEYARRVTGNDPQPTDASNILEALPPLLTRSNKLGLGTWDEPTDTLLAFCDVLHNWPHPGVAHVGLLLVHGQHQGKGLGRLLHDHVVERALAWRDVDTLRLSIVATNAEIAEPFWQALDYHPTGETAPYTAGNVESTAAIWERPLPR